MNDVMDVVEYFLFKVMDNDGESITNLKLQKLIYYAQGFHLALYEAPLFNEPIEAWRHGPVCPKVYHEFKEYGSAPIEYHNSPNFDTLFTPEQIELLDEIYEVFGQYSAWKLREMTHEEPTWIHNESNASEITKLQMMEYFATRVR